MDQINLIGSLKKFIFKLYNIATKLNVLYNIVSQYKNNFDNHSKTFPCVLFLLRPIIYFYFLQLVDPNIYIHLIKFFIYEGYAYNYELPSLKPHSNS